MKKITLLAIVFCTLQCFSQVPTIRERYRKIKIDTTTSTQTKNEIARFVAYLKAKEGLTSNADVYKRIEALLSSIKPENKAEVSKEITFLNGVNQLLDFDKTGFKVKAGGSGLDAKLTSLKSAVDDFPEALTPKADSLTVALDSCKKDALASENIIPSLAIPFYENKVQLLKTDLQTLERKNSFATESELLSVSEAIEAKQKELKALRKALFCAKKEHFWSDSFFPTSRPTRALAFESIYDKDNEKSFYFGNEATLLFNTSGEGATVETELASAYLGAFKITFGSLLSNEGTQDASAEGDETAEANTMETEDTAAFQRLISKGGNAYMEIVYPIHYYQSERAFTYFNLGARAGVEIQEFNTDVDTSNGVGSVFGNFYYSVSTDNNEFNFFTNINYGLYAGGNDFYKRLSVTDEKPFGFGDFTVGVTVRGNIRFAATLATFSSDRDLRSNTVMLSTQILSNIFKK